MRRENLYLDDIVQAAEEIQEFLAGVSKESFLGNNVLRSAVLNKLTIIGEAAARLGKDFKAAHADVRGMTSWLFAISSFTHTSP